MTDFILFGTEGCHLCELAADLLGETGIRFQQVDIMANTEWQEKYGLRIPVLLHSKTGRELNWPFDKLQLLNF